MNYCEDYADIEGYIQLYFSNALLVEVVYTEELKNALVDWYTSDVDSPYAVDDSNGGTVLFHKRDLVCIRFPQK